MSTLTGPKITMFSGASLGDNYLTPGNTMLRGLQALLQANVINMTTATPPGSPNNGDTYVVASSPTGAWAGHTNAIVYWTTQNLGTPAWDFWNPVEGWQVYDQSTNQFYKFDGAAWVTNAGGPSLEVDGTPNASQSLLNFFSNPQVTWADDGAGKVEAFVNTFGGIASFGGAGSPISVGPFSLAVPIPTVMDYIVILGYDASTPLVNPGILSVNYVDTTHFEINSSSATDASTVRYMVLSIVSA